eukprot:2850742-Rhodomonas_salina.2
MGAVARTPQSPRGVRAILTCGNRTAAMSWFRVSARGSSSGHCMLKPTWEQSVPSGPPSQSRGSSGGKGGGSEPPLQPFRPPPLVTPPALPGCPPLRLLATATALVSFALQTAPVVLRPPLGGADGLPVQPAPSDPAQGEADLEEGAGASSDGASSQTTARTGSVPTEARTRFSCLLPVPLSSPFSSEGPWYGVLVTPFRPISLARPPPATLGSEAGLMWSGRTREALVQSWFISAALHSTPAAEAATSSSPIRLAPASSRDPLRTAVTLGPDWSSPGRPQGFVPPTPGLTIECSPGRRVALSARVLNDAALRRAPQRSGTPTPW